METVTLGVFLERLGVEEPDYEIGLILDKSVDNATKYFVTRASDSTVRISLKSRRHPMEESHEGWVYLLDGGGPLMDCEMYAVEWVFVAAVGVHTPTMRVCYKYS